MMSLSLGLGLTSVRGGAFDPVSLFANGEQGALLLPGPTTSFLSTTNLTPCSEGDPVGFQLDQSQGSGYSNGAFTGLGEEAGVAGSYTKNDVNDLTITLDGPLEEGKRYVVSFSVSDKNEGPTPAVHLKGVVGIVQYNLPAEGGDFQVKITLVANNSTSDTLTFKGSAALLTVSNISVRELPGNHATQATLPSRPTLEQTAGGLWYLDFDGVDDGLATASIDFTATDKISVFAGVGKESESATSILLESSADWNTNSGSFVAVVNGSVGTIDWQGASRGAAAQNSNQSASSNDAQPSLVVMSNLHDISGDSTILRINGSEIDEATGDKGAGNFGSYPLYIGSRAVSSLFFDGRIYGLIVRGAASTAQEISNAEALMAQRSGVTL